MSEMLARFFRWNNSLLINSDNLLLEKLLKLFLFVSTLVYRRAMPAISERSCPVVIENFDIDLKLSIDRCRAMGAALYWTGFHEFREFQFLHRHLKPDMVFVDVGANLGEYSLFAAKRLSRGKVLAFEPLPSIRTVLDNNIKLNAFRNITVFPLGLSDRGETLIIHEFVDVHEGLATFYPGERKSKSTLAVELKTMDEVVSSVRPGRIDFVKIDIEGGELKALRGCTTVISLYRPAFMIEINEQTYRSAGYSTDDVLVFFNNVKYQAYHIIKRGLLKKCTELPAFGNIVFMPE